MAKLDGKLKMLAREIQDAVVTYLKSEYRKVHLSVSSAKLIKLNIPYGKATYQM
jgi:hypothetical protein